MSLPKRHVLLPDLVDDMDISQKLAILLVDGVIAKLPRCDAALRRETSVVLSHSGKTERGVGATLRVLNPRLRRQFAGLDHVIESLAVASDSVRPSGPYTLQCMMPNVAAGRAALQLDLNGPNFVVDAGSISLEAAATSASLLLRAGDRGATKLVIVAAINANPWRVPYRGSPLPSDESAAAFAVTSRRHAQELGLTVIAPMEELIAMGCKCADGESPATTTAQKVRKVLDQLRRLQPPIRLRSPGRTPLRRRQRSSPSMFPYGSKLLPKTTAQTRGTAMRRRSWRSFRRSRILSRRLP